MAEYTIERGVGVADRMNLLAAAHAPATLSLLDMVGVAPGARCVDLGCGGGHVAMELARRSGPSGHVLGIDLDGELIEAARGEAAAQGLRNLRFREGPVEQLSEAGFDLAFSRMVLSHLADPAAMVALIVDSVCQGGIVVVEDVHFAGCFTEPGCAAYDRWLQWFRETVRRHQGDLDIGPQLPGLLRGAGLTSLGVRVAQPAQCDGPTKQLQQMPMAKTRAAILATGVTTANEFDAAHTELKAFTDNPSTIVASPRRIQSWGRRA